RILLAAEPPRALCDHGEVGERVGKVWTVGRVGKTDPRVWKVARVRKVGTDLNPTVQTFHDPPGLSALPAYPDPPDCPDFPDPPAPLAPSIALARSCSVTRYFAIFLPSIINTGISRP